ncbi:MAG TPA: hypothetical protein PLL30_00160 [Candidatus Krumholzibacteria bacterium]|nr:hypothetical protein [Candidatus Krumholzibacteria bacterium]HPD70171.1 hypothetical protein [Candidatus Krumholzibacteria bacterium]HRY40129.1 hypothetical protein [Candidatus Krumholzibacteria bacterium]
MDQLLYRVLPQTLLLLFGALLGIWGILVRRADLGLEKAAVRIGWIGAACLLAWLVAVTALQRQLPMLSPGQLAFFLGSLVWLGQCYAQRHVDQRLFAVLPLVGVAGLMAFGLAMGLRPGEVPTKSLLSAGAAVHVTMSLAGVALLLGCGVYASGHVILDWHIRRRRFDAWFQRLPSLGDLDRLRRLTLVTGWALVTASLLSALVWTRVRPSAEPTVISHLHPMVLLAVILAVLVVADRQRWLSAHRLAVGCVVMSGLVLALLTVSVVEIFAGRFA